MSKRTILATATTVQLLVALSASAQPATSDNGLELVLLGQALIEHDPRGSIGAPLESVVPLLADADVVFTNLEVPVCSRNAECQSTKSTVYAHGADPSVLDYLDSIGVSLLSLANNHSWDLGTAGLLSGINEVSRRGIAHAGTGRTIQEALAPAYIDTGAHRVALVAAATTNLDPDAPATATHPGVNVFLPDDAEAWNRNIESIRDAAATANPLIAYQHFQRQGTHEWQRRWAKAAIDAGADIYVSHGEPVLSGIELYRGGIIFYGLGNFIFHTRTEIGFYPAEVWQTVLVKLSMDNGRFQSVELVPLVIDEGEPGPNFLEERGYPSVATGNEAKAILEGIVNTSREYGTEIEIVGERAFVDISRFR